MILEPAILESLEKEKFVFFDGRFSLTFLNELESLFLKYSADFRQASISKNKEVHTSIRGDLIYWLQPEKHPKLFSILQQIKNELSQYFLISLNHIESHLAHYPAEKGYEKHIDQPKNNQQRRVFSMIIYLNKDWERQNGGELILFKSDSPQQIQQVIEPIYGRAVLFFSDQVPHQVTKTFCERKSLTLWFRHDIIP